jgi:uncharacterized protein GlcG (DUF336 family)
MITLEKAQSIIAAGKAKANEIGQPMNIAVVDAGTNLKSRSKKLRFMSKGLVWSSV